MTNGTILLRGMKCCALVFGFFLFSPVWAQPSSDGPDSYQLEAQLFEYLLDQQLYDYAELLLEEAKIRFPSRTDSVEVLQAGLTLKLGRVEEVEQYLATTPLVGNPKAQAILLQLANYNYSLGDEKKAEELYGQFLKLNEGKELQDEDLIRYFSSAALRLGAIQQKQGKVAEAIKTYEVAASAAKNKVLRRKFRVNLSDAYVTSLQLNPADKPEEWLKKIDEVGDQLVWEGFDNFYFANRGLAALARVYTGDTTGAMELLNEHRADTIQMEKNMREAKFPLSEFPRPYMKFAAGEIYWQRAKQYAGAGEIDDAKKATARAASEFYNTFLRYEGHPYAEKAGFRFDELKDWIGETLGEDVRSKLEASMGGAKSAGGAELVFSRELNKAKELIRQKKFAEAEAILVPALGEYPLTKYSVDALSTLARSYRGQEKHWEEAAVADYLTELWPGDEAAGKVVLGVGSALYRAQFKFGYEQVLLGFGRTYNDNPRAPKFFFQIARMIAQDPERVAEGHALYKELIERYPGSAESVRALESMATSLMKEGNFTEAADVYQGVLDSSPPGPARAGVQRRMAEALLRMESEDGAKRAVELMEDVVRRLNPKKNDPAFYGKGDEVAARSRKVYEQSIYTLSRAYLTYGGQTKDTDVQAKSAEVGQQYLSLYPKGQYAPATLYNLGRLYLQQAKTADALDAFERLARDFPDSELGKDASYNVVQAALDEGLTEVAEQAVLEMVAQSDLFEARKIERVARLMFERKAYKGAYAAYGVVMKKTKDPQRLLIAKHRYAVSAMGVGKNDVAAKQLTELIEENPNSSLVVDAGLSLAELELGRGKLSAAKAALQNANSLIRRSSKPRPLAALKIRVASAKISYAEGNAGAAFNVLFDVALHSPQSPAEKDVVEDAIEASIQAGKKLIDAGDDEVWRDIEELAGLYIKHFPLSDAKKLEEMRQLRRDAIRNAP